MYMHTYTIYHYILIYIEGAIFTPVSKTGAQVACPTFPSAAKPSF